MVVCTGEDPEELTHAIRTVIPGSQPQYHHYRCYHAWKFGHPDLTVILSGIGSGCLEPLLFEILDYESLGDKTAKRLVMIGTAGRVPDIGVEQPSLGQVYLVDAAYTVGCAVALDDDKLPVRPNFGGLDEVELPRAEEISTGY
jgi:hypothetical protein